MVTSSLSGRHIFTVGMLFLKDRIPPFPTPEALKFFESQFGLPASKVFAEISEKPVAAASLGQVYRGITTSLSVVFSLRAVLSKVKKLMVNAIMQLLRIYIDR